MTAAVKVRPVRIELSRRKGWRMPPNTVKVSRPTEWGNPVRVGTYKGFTSADAVKWFRDYLHNHPDGWRLVERLGELRGKNLACWCPLDQPCHADVLLEIANA